MDKSEALAAIRADPRDARAWFILGTYLADEGNTAKARDCFQVALEHNPQLHIARAALARLDESQPNHPDMAEVVPIAWSPDIHGDTETRSEVADEGNARRSPWRNPARRLLLFIVVLANIGILLFFGRGMALLGESGENFFAGQGTATTTRTGIIAAGNATPTPTRAMTATLPGTAPGAASPTATPPFQSPTASHEMSGAPSPSLSPSTTPEPSLTPVVVTARVRQPSDDAEELTSNNTVSIYSSDLELVNDRGYGGPQIVGLRFQSVPVPRGARVHSAYIEFWADEPDVTVTTLVFFGEASDNPPTFQERASDISGRSLTLNSVTWTEVPPWREIDEVHRTPDLSSIVQEVISREGWREGSSLVFVVMGSGERTAVAFDGNEAKAPRLYIEYETG